MVIKGTFLSPSDTERSADANPYGMGWHSPCLRVASRRERLSIRWKTGKRVTPTPLAVFRPIKQGQRATVWRHLCMFARSRSGLDSTLNAHRQNCRKRDS